MVRPEKISTKLLPLQISCMWNQELPYFGICSSIFCEHITRIGLHTIVSTLCYDIQIWKNTNVKFWTWSISTYFTWDIKISLAGLHGKLWHEFPTLPKLNSLCKEGHSTAIVNHHMKPFTCTYRKAIWWRK